MEILYSCFNFVDNLKKNLKRQENEAKIKKFHVKALKIFKAKTKVLAKLVLKSFLMINMKVNFNGL